MITKHFEEIFLLFGIIASLIFFVADLMAIKFVKKYNFITQSINELHAVGAPSRPFLVASNISIFLLILFFGIGVWSMASDNWALYLIAILIITFSIFNFIGLFYPMRVGQSPNTMNVIIGALGVFSLTFAIPLGALAFNGWFRILSVVISIIFILLTILGTLVLPRVIKNTKPTTGIQERVMIYTIFIWVTFLALKLLNVF